MRFLDLSNTKNQERGSSRQSPQLILCSENVREMKQRLRDLSGCGRIYVVAWAPRSPGEASLAELFRALPSQAALVLTGSCGGLPVWKSMSTGDLRALADQFASRWIAIEPDARQAVVGVMQQLNNEDALLVIRPATVPVRDIARWIAAGETYRGLSPAWDE